MGAKDTLKQLLPPVALEGYRRIRRWGNPSSIEWQYIPEGWAYLRQHPEVRGWNVEEILDVSKAKWARFQELARGTGPLGFSHESDVDGNTNPDFQNEILIFAYALALAARQRDEVSMLDWGGGIGHYYLLARAVVPDILIDYHCRDLPLLAGHGPELLPEQHFYSDDSCLQRNYDFTLASSSMQYAREWNSVLFKLAAATRGYCLVTRMPIVLRADSFVFVQRPYVYGYDTEYLGWCVNRGALIDQAARGGLALVREFVIPFAPTIADAPEPCQYRGFLFRRA